VIGYEKKRVSSGERLSVHELELPPSRSRRSPLDRRSTSSLPLAVARRRLNTWEHPRGRACRDRRSSALCAVRARRRRDQHPLHAQVGKGAVFIYDGYAGGVGLAEASFARIGELLERTLELIASCDCETGCGLHLLEQVRQRQRSVDKEAAVTVLSCSSTTRTRAWREAAAVDDEGSRRRSAQEPQPEPEFAARA